MVVCLLEEGSVLFGRCLIEGALLAEGHVRGKDLVSSVHGWGSRDDSRIGTYNYHEVLEEFSSGARSR